MKKKWPVRLASAAVALALAAPYADAATHRGTPQGGNPLDLSSDPLLGDTGLLSDPSGDLLNQGLPQSLGQHKHHKRKGGQGGTGNPPPTVGGPPAGGCQQTVTTVTPPPAPPVTVPGGKHGAGQHHRLPSSLLSNSSGSNSTISSGLVSKRAVVVAQNSISPSPASTGLGSHVNFHKGHKGSGTPPGPVTPPIGSNTPPSGGCDPCLDDPTAPGCTNDPPPQQAPEPGSLALIAVAMAALAGFRRRFLLR